MSWIFGTIAARMRPERLRSLAAHHPSTDTIITSSHLYLAFGGIAETRCFESDDDARSGWLAAGIGLERNAMGCRLLDRDDWRAILGASRGRRDTVDGHYVALRWNGDEVEFFCDQLGMRTLYLARREGETIFSTRLDWLARSMGGCEIDLTMLGAHWLLSNQLEPTSLVRGIERLPPGGHARCRPGTIELRGEPWPMPEEAADEEESIATIASFLNPQCTPGRQLALGLSGGMDSRVLLAMLMRDSRPFTTYVVGRDDSPDVRIAATIARREHLEQLRFNHKLPEPAELAALVEEYAAETCAVEPPCSALSFHYADLHARGYLLIDGGFGEIGRRQCMKRLIATGAGVARRGRPEEIMPLLASHRIGMMNRDAMHVMRSGALAEIETAWSRMPPITSIGADAFADLLTIRTRFPHYAGRGQSCTDPIMLSYMPFAQPSVVRALLSLPSRARRNARLYRALIRASRSSLAALPLVKGGSLYPFILPTVGAWAYVKLGNKVGREWRDPRPTELLLALEEYVRDLVVSSAVRGYAPYDHRALAAKVESFYAGEHSLAMELNWWLAFDAWRRRCEGEDVREKM